MMHKHTNRKGSDVSHEVTRCIRKGAEIARRGAWGCAWETHEASRGGGEVRRDRAADDEVDMVRVSELAALCVDRHWCTTTYLLRLHGRCVGGRNVRQRGGGALWRHRGGLQRLTRRSLASDDDNPLATVL